MTETNTRVLTGQVVSVKPDKTVIVTITVKKPHPLYGKFMKKRTKYYIHDEDNICSEGDTVEFVQCRPISKMKKWKLVKVV
jgi:small subunit ribosomal protein S17